MDEFLIGTCQVQLKNLSFEHGRDKLPQATERLAQLFQAWCEPNERANHIPAVVSTAELNAILGESGLSIQDIVQGSPEPPCLSPPSLLRCIHGRQRYEAALLVMGPEAWWTIRLFCIPADSDVTACLFREADQYFFQTPPSDGVMFCKIRELQQAGLHKQAKHWRLRLSSSKKVALRAIDTRPALLAHLDQLRVFPGLWDGLRLGCIEKHLAIHATEEMLRYLQHVFRAWRQITLEDPELATAADVATVRGLELRVPGISRSDATAVREMMRSGILFSRIAEPGARIRLQESILRVECIIPSFATFHDNMNYLGVGMQIMRDNLLGNIGEKTMQQAMRDCWKSPGRCLVEYHEGMYREAAHLEPTAAIAYCQVFLAALRHFPELSFSAPRRERKQEPSVVGPRKRRVEMFLEAAQRHGFHGQVMSRSSACATIPYSPGIAAAAFLTESCLKRRSGRPFTRSFAFYRTRLFLPDLLEAAESQVDDHPTTMFVQYDFIEAFFGVRSAIKPSHGSNSVLHLVSSLRAGSPILTESVGRDQEQQVIQSPRTPSTMVTAPTQPRDSSPSNDWPPIAMQIAQREASPDIREARDSTPWSPSERVRTLVRPGDILHDQGGVASRFSVPVSSAPSNATLSPRSLLLPSSLRNLQDFEPDYVRSPQKTYDHRDDQRSRSRTTLTWHTPRSHETTSVTSRDSVRSIFLPDDIV